MFNGNHVSLFGYSGEDRFSDEESDILRLNFQTVDDSVDQLPSFEGILEMIVLISRGV